MAERRLGIVKRTSLEDVAEGWTRDCYLLYRPATYGDMQKLKVLNVDGMDDQKGVEFMLDFIRQHLVGGKVMVLNSTDQLDLADIEVGDLDQLPPQTINAIFADMTGVGLDPKGTPEAPAAEPGQPQDGSSTETSSSAA